MSLNSTTRVVRATSTCGPTEPADRHDRPVRPEHRDRLVDRAVVAVVVDDDLRSTGDLAREAEDPAVRVARGQGELPGADAEPAGQLVADPGGILGREHVGDAAAHLAFDRGHRRRRAVAGHRAGVAEAEVDVVVAVDAAEMGARGALDVRRERAGPLDHPGHRARPRGASPWPARAAPRIADARRRRRPSRRPSGARGGRDRGRGGQSRPQDAGVEAPAARSSRAVGQWMWRTKPQMWQVAVPVSGSRSSRLAQPLVPQKRRLFALKDRRRMRRTAEARPVTDAWVLRVIMVACSCAFWRALIAA